MENGQKILAESIVKAQRLVFENPCGMTDVTMGAMAAVINSFIEAEVNKERPYKSRDGAAQYLGISTRTLGRLVAEGKITPHRKGFLNQIYYVDELDLYLGSVKKVK